MVTGRVMFIIIIICSCNSDNLGRVVTAVKAAARAKLSTS